MRALHVTAVFFFFSFSLSPKRAQKGTRMASSMVITARDLLVAGSQPSQRNPVMQIGRQGERGVMILAVHLFGHFTGASVVPNPQPACLLDARKKN
ncbi:hypothetical protein F5Y16DRAFT_390267 [Xylariaceae sp. FL0255]|nr:hypothetical protein F5Y16DRAFT_390267 [Xylariaceae sp. FL0255]